MKTCSRALRTSDWGEGSLSNRTMTLSTQPCKGRSCRSGFGTSLWISLSVSTRARTWTQFNHLMRDLKIAVQQHSPSNLTEVEMICREEWKKLPKYRCAKLLESYPRRLEVVVAAKGASTKYWVKGLNTDVNFVFQFLFLTPLQKCLMGVLFIDWLGEKQFYQY